MEMWRSDTLVRSSDPAEGHAHIWRTISEWTLERDGKTAQDGGHALAEDTAWAPQGDNGTVTETFAALARASVRADALSRPVAIPMAAQACAAGVSAL